MPGAPDDVVRRLAAACHTGDVLGIEALLDPDAVAVCDSGGRVPAPIRPVHGAAEVAWLLRALLPGTNLPGTNLLGTDLPGFDLAGFDLAGFDLAVESVNGRAGLVIRRTGRAVAVIAVSCAEDRATALWVVLNPDKLRRWNLVSPIHGSGPESASALSHAEEEDKGNDEHP
jgi:hypothetical protein